jgi:hypothetical protein
MNRLALFQLGNAYLDSVYTLSLDEDENKMVATWIGSYGNTVMMAMYG